MVIAGPDRKRIWVSSAVEKTSRRNELASYLWQQKLSFYNSKLWRTKIALEVLIARVCISLPPTYRSHVVTRHHIACTRSSGESD